jgi:RNA polymerase sigma factor (sigma-70 family)
MNGDNLANAIRHLRRNLAERDRRGPTDGELLQGFVASREEAAFEALVRRHGPMVFAVCRRVLGDLHDAEDAFQAAFLVLLHKAGSIGRPEQMSNWLYGVAYRTALKAREKRTRRREREVHLADVAGDEGVDDVAGTQIRQVLDDELLRLPEKYRLPILLHYLEGKTKRQTAQQLGWPEGTVSIRLSRGRDLLRVRLARRGLACSGAVLAAMLSWAKASAAVPLPLITATSGAAAKGGLVGGISARVAALTREVLHAMFLTKLKFATGMLLVVCLGGSAFVCAHWAKAASGVWAADTARPATVPPFGAIDEVRRPPNVILKHSGPEPIRPAKLHGIDGLNGLPAPLGFQFVERRLGACLKKPNATLIEQLDLPQERGLVLEHVAAGSPAARGGLRECDILLALDGKVIPSNRQRFLQLLEKIKPYVPVIAEVLRKGKKVTVRGLSLPEAPPGLPLPGPLPGALLAPPPGLGLGLIAGRLGGLDLPDQPPSSIIAFQPSLIRDSEAATTIVFHDKDRFMAWYLEGLLAILITGAWSDGKATAGEIWIQDGARWSTHQRVANVPEEYHSKVEKLLETSGKGQGEHPESPTGR